jgi:uncharacterized linocin/CFP29 family protein
MDILKKELAPLSAQAWEELEERAAQVLRSRLSARRVIRVVGPKGWAYTAVPEGRLDLVDDESDVKAGVYSVKPLVEARTRFSVNRWEMDNATRGAKDIDFSSLDAAVERMAAFEDQAVYYGYDKGGIVGLAQVYGAEPVAFGSGAQQIMESVSQSMVALRSNHAQGPLSLVVGTEAWVRLNKEIQGIPLVERIERMIGGKVVHSLSIDGAMLLPYDDGNLELTIGQDFSIGYEYHDSREITLFLTESFTFRVLDPSLVVVFAV